MMLPIGVNPELIQKEHKKHKMHKHTFEEDATASNSEVVVYFSKQ